MALAITDTSALDARTRPADASGRNGGQSAGLTSCFHCGTKIVGHEFFSAGKAFCCHGCVMVFELLTENGLGGFYEISESAGVQVKQTPGVARYRFLDAPFVREKLLDFADAKMARITLHLPAIHCIACVWLLENLFRLREGIGQTQVNFPRKEAAISFDPAKIQLSEVVNLLASLGYEPELNLSHLGVTSRPRASRKLWVQLGFAGFAFGNIMLFSISSYLGLDTFSGTGFRALVGGISLVLALPVVIYSAQDYWRAAWTSLRQRLLNIDVPIAAGIAAIFIQSSIEVLTGRGPGYFDSLTGLIFFLLCGRLFQQKTYARLAFDRDYRSFFPMSARRRTSQGEEHVSLEKVQSGDRLIIRNGELIPADAQLVNGPALIDYSFVTGESEPLEKKVGDLLYAGGRQMGGAIEVLTVKAVSQSYLTSLWNQDAFRKDREESLQSATNRYSQRFTRLVLAVALGSAIFWAYTNPSVSIRAFASVLIVACPCALALAAPFALGSAQRALGRRNIYLKNPAVLERLATLDVIVFDKTGTLTAPHAGSVTWEGAPLTEWEERLIFSMTRHSTHPLPVRIGDAISHGHFPEPTRSFIETTGCGMEGSVAGQEIWMGARGWLESRGVHVPAAGVGEGSVVHVAIQGKFRGSYRLATALRPDIRTLVDSLERDFQIALLSGDKARERGQFESLFGHGADLRFGQTPLDKLEFIHERQDSGHRVMMVGDGLNDAGALKQSDVGVAVVEKVGAFSPASDIIMPASMLPHLGSALQYARRSARIVRTSFFISAVYNAIGIVIAAQGLLSPVVCAILMPLSSVSVVAFACGAAAWQARKLDSPGGRA